MSSPSEEEKNQRFESGMAWAQTAVRDVLDKDELEPEDIPFFLACACAVALMALEAAGTKRPEIEGLAQDCRGVITEALKEEPETLIGGETKH